MKNDNFDSQEISADGSTLFSESERDERIKLKLQFKNIFLVKQYLETDSDSLISQFSFEEEQNFLQLMQKLNQISEIFRNSFENRDYSNLRQITVQDLKIFDDWKDYFGNKKFENKNETLQNYLLLGLLPNLETLLDKLLNIENKLDSDKTKFPLQTAIEQTKENIRTLKTKITITQLKLDKAEKFENVTRIELWIKSVEESIKILNQILLESQKGQLEEQFRQQAIENLNRLFNTEILQTDKTDKQNVQQTQTSNIPLSSTLVKTDQIMHQPTTQIEKRDYSEGIKSYGELKKLLAYFEQNYPHGSNDIKIKNPETGKLIAKIGLSSNSNESEISYENSKQKVYFQSSISFPKLVDLPKKFPTKEEWNEILKDLDGHYLDKYNYSQYPRFFNKIGKDEYGNGNCENLLDDFIKFLKFSYDTENKQAYQDVRKLITQINFLLVSDTSIFFQETVEKKKIKSKNEKTHQIKVQYYASPNIQKVVDLIRQFNQKGYDFQIGSSFKEISYYDADENDIYSPTQIVKLENIGDIIANFNNLLKKIFPDEKQRENIIREITTKNNDLINL